MLTPDGSSAFTTAVRPDLSPAASRVKSRRLASRYASMVPWKSRWSWVRLVKTAMSKSMPSTRDSASPWEETSMATAVTPALTIRRSSD